LIPPGKSGQGDEAIRQDKRLVLGLYMMDGRKERTDPDSLMILSKVAFLRNLWM
jgi:hypothetical protein